METRDSEHSCKPRLTVMLIPARSPSNRAGRRIGNFEGTCRGRTRGTLSRSRGVRRNSGRKHANLFSLSGETTLRESSRGASDREILARCGPHYVVFHANNRNLVTGSTPVDRQARAKRPVRAHWRVVLTNPGGRARQESVMAALLKVSGCRNKQIPAKKWSVRGSAFSRRESLR